MVGDVLSYLLAGLRAMADVQTASMVVTAIATIGLGIFTWVLARETKRLSNATAQAHVVATLEPNDWAINHLDLIVTNTGNAAAHDVEVTFSPELEKYKGNLSGERPLKRVSVLKPGQSLSSYVGEFSLYNKKTYQITTSWKHRPAEKRRLSLSYEQSLDDYEGFGTLGARSPLIQIAEQVKKLREDWQYVASGSRKLSADVYSSEDRAREQRDRQKQREEYRSRAVKKPEGDAK